MAVLLSGCAAGLRLLRDGGSGGSGGRPRSRATQVYLSQLAAEQGRLALAEHALPPPPHTRAALVHWIRDLGGEIRRFAGGLARIAPPRGVVRLHHRLVAIERAFHAQLLVLAARAARPASEVAAANALDADTRAASDGFTATFVKIHARLVH